MGGERGMRQWRKRVGALALAVTVVLSLFLLAGCKGKPLPEGMDKETVQTKAEEVLALLADGDYTQVAEQFRQDVREEYGVTADTITQAMEQVAGAGAYVKLADSTVVGGENENFDGEYAVAVLYCKHEKKKVVYQFSIDPSYQLIGFSAQIR